MRGVNLRNGFKIMILLLIFICKPSARVFAANSTINKIESNITLDGNFDDWNDKPFIIDDKHDVKNPGMDILGVGYFSDNEYLYLKVERQSANKSQPWKFSVIILNAEKGEKQLQSPFGVSKPIYAPQFDIITEYMGNKSHSGTVVNVSFNGENIESTFSASNNAKEIELRIPLAKVGLDGLNKEIQFMLKSDTDPKTGEVDWIPDNRPIIVTTGPTFWQFSSIFVFVGVSFAAFRVYKNKNEKIQV